MKTLNFALIGCGALARIHARCVAKIKEARFVAYCDVHVDAAQTMLDEYNGQYATSDVSRILKDDSIDAVYICTRHDSHAQLAIDAAHAGKHIMCEKPLALTAASCEAVAWAVQETGVHFMSAFKLRYYPLVQRARAFIPVPQVLVAQVMDARWPDEHWAQDPLQGGANVHSQGCHATDLLRYFAGSEPSHLWAAGGAMTHPGHPCIDQCVATIVFENGSVASWIQGDAGLAPFTSKFYFALFGDNKSVQITDRLKRADFNDGQKTWTETSDEEEGFQLENEAFVQALLANKPPEITVQDGIMATRMVLASDQAIRTGKVQRVRGSK